MLCCLSRLLDVSAANMTRSAACAIVDAPHATLPMRQATCICVSHFSSTAYNSNRCGVSLP